MTLLIPIVVIILLMVFMSRSAKNRQRKAQEARSAMQPGSGVRTIGGLYATVKSLSDDAVLLEVAPGVHCTYAKTAVAAVLEPEEYNRVVDGVLAGESEDYDGVDAEVDTDDESAATAIDLTKGEDGADDAEPADAAETETEGAQAEAKPEAEAEAEPEPEPVAVAAGKKSKA